MCWLLPAQEEGEEAGGEILKIYWEFFCFSKCFVFVLLNWGREGKKTTKPVCSVSWGNPFRISVLLFPELSNKATAFPWLALIPTYQQPEMLRKEKGKHAAEPGFLKPPHMAISAPEVLSEGSVFRNHQQRLGPIVPCAVQTHSEGPSLPQRTYPTNRDYRGNVAGELETSCLAQGCTAGCGRQRQKPGILISSPAICSFSPTTTFCLRGVNGTKDNSVWLGIFNRWELHIQAHTLLDSQGQLPPPGPNTVWRVLSWDKVTFRAEIQYKERERKAWLLWNLAVETPSGLAAQTQKTLCLKDLRIDIGRTVFISR